MVLGEPPSMSVEEWEECRWGCRETGSLSSEGGVMGSYEVDTARLEAVEAVSIGVESWWEDCGFGCWGWSVMGKNLD